MKNEDKTITPAHREAFNRALAQYAYRSEVTGVDIGFRWCQRERTDEVCVRLHVKEKYVAEALSDKEIFPTEIERVRVDVLQANYASQELGHYVDEPGRRHRADVLQPGISVGPRRGGTGTLGLIVKDPQDQMPCILGCAHVLASRLYPEPGDRILQPASADGGRRRDTVSRLLRFDLAQDWALAKLNNNRAWMAEQLGSGIMVAGSRWPALGDLLEKSGRTTAVTRGVVDGIGSYMGLTPAFRLVPEDPAPDVEISHRGDSGAIWYDPNTREGVGLHSKGEENQISGNEYAIATMLHLLVVVSEIEL